MLGVSKYFQKLNFIGKVPLPKKCSRGVAGPRARPCYATVWTWFWRTTTSKLFAWVHCAKSAPI